MKKTIKECFIIGSGSSLLNLTKEEKAYLNAHPNTLAMNKYLLFYEKIGVIPKALFLGDHHYPAHQVFTETLEKARLLDPIPTFYVDKYYKKLFFRPDRYPYWNLKQRYNLYKQNKYFAPLWFSYPKLVFFSAENRDLSEFIWAKSLHEQLFFQRGSLTTALNLAYIIYPGCDVKLIGVDLNQSGAFFDKDIKHYPRFIDNKYGEHLRSNKKHSTVIKTAQGTVLDRFLEIRQEFAAKEAKLLCCNPKSLVVTEGFAKYTPILNCTKV